MASAPVGMTSIFRCELAAPSRMMAPSPNDFVMVEMAASRSRDLAAESLVVSVVSSALDSDGLVSIDLAAIKDRGKADGV